MLPTACRGCSVAPWNRVPVAGSSWPNWTQPSGGLLASRASCRSWLILDGRPLNNRAAARRDAQAQWAQVWQQLDAALAGAGIADAVWVPEWIAELRRTGVLTRAGTDAASRALGHAVSALKILLLPTDQPSTGWELAALATKITGDAHAFDDTSLASVVMLRAAAHALRHAVPESASDRRELWRALGVATDAVSGTVLAWQLRPPGADRWSRMMRDRADLGLITHLTLHELDRAGTVEFARAGQAVFVCENPQVLQAAARAGTGMPLLCLSGNPARVGTQLLRELTTGGVHVQYHGDFDWPGVAHRRPDHCTRREALASVRGRLPFGGGRSRCRPCGRAHRQSGAHPVGPGPDGCHVRARVGGT